MNDTPPTNESGQTPPPRSAGAPPPMPPPRPPTGWYNGPYPPPGFVVKESVGRALLRTVVGSMVTIAGICIGLVGVMVLFFIALAAAA